MKNETIAMTGKTWNSFCAAYDDLQSNTGILDVCLADIDIVYVDEKGATIFHNGYDNAIDIPENSRPDFEGDGIRIGVEYYAITQKAFMDIAVLAGLSGEGSAKQCRERAALVSRLIAYSEDVLKFIVKKGTILRVKKSLNACPSIVETINTLPSRRVHLGTGTSLKRVRRWMINEDFYKVWIEYQCLGKTDTLTPYCVVQDSDTGESSLTLTFGAMFNKGDETGFLPMSSKSYRHDNAVTVFDIYIDINYYVIDQFMEMKTLIEKAKEYPAEELSADKLSKTFRKNLNRKMLQSLDFSGTTLYDQIVSLTISTTKAIGEAGVKQQNAIMNALYGEIMALVV